ncbi:MAG: cupin domain-containing protein [Proteobacteria bacterium]|nr:cupin domain-containing protein [Pseudomonadota bacterium]
MTAAIRTPSRAELDKRIARFEQLQPMSTSKDLDWVPQPAKDIVFARKIMPVILEETKSPFGSSAPIFGAAGTTMFVSRLPAGTGPCLHSHNDTYETFFVLEGSIEYLIGDPVAHRVTLNKWDCLSCPPRIYRGFRNVGSADAVLLTVITGVVEARDDVSIPNSIGVQIQRAHGDKVLDAFKALLRFDPPTKDA